MQSIILYDTTDGEPMSLTKAKKLFRQGIMISDPNRHGAEKILNYLGYAKVKTINDTSSSGDWIFKIRGGYVFQYNRHPYHGFNYWFKNEAQTHGG